MEAEAGRSPGLHRVTILAFQAKTARVNFGFGVAADALPRRSFENPILVAISALDGGVSSLQGKYLGMVKVAQPVDAIMAIQASRSKLIHMLGHK